MKFRTWTERAAAAAAVVAAGIGVTAAVLTQQDLNDAERTAEELADQIAAECAAPPVDPSLAMVCRRAAMVADESGDDDDESEVQDPEVQNPEVQQSEAPDPEAQEPEIQDPEVQQPPVPGPPGPPGPPGRPPAGFAFVLDGARYVCLPTTDPTPGASPVYRCTTREPGGSSAPSPSPSPDGGPPAG